MAVLFAEAIISGCGPVDRINLQQDDRIVFLGDSITQTGVKLNGYVTLTRKGIKKAFPDLKVKVIGAGISGHKVPDCQQRLYRDVLRENPTIVIIYIGINDVWHWESNQGTSKEDFESGLRDMISRIDSVGARVVLCTPTVIGEMTDGTNNFDPMLEEYSGISRKVAEETGAIMLDLRKEFMAYLLKNNPENKSEGILTRDSVHLNKRGNRYLADLMLGVLNVPSG